MRLCSSSQLAPMCSEWASPLNCWSGAKCSVQRMTASGNTRRVDFQFNNHITIFPSSGVGSGWGLARQWKAQRPAAGRVLEAGLDQISKGSRQVRNLSNYGRIVIMCPNGPSGIASWLSGFGKRTSNSCHSRPEQGRVGCGPRHGRSHPPTERLGPTQTRPDTTSKMNVWFRPKAP